MTATCSQALRFSPVLALAALAGCTVGPDYMPPQRELSVNYSSLSDVTDATTIDPLVSLPTTSQPLSTEALATWWRTFDDPTLDALVDRAVNGNLTLASARARLRESRALLGVAESARYPQVAASAGFSRFRNSQNTVNGGFGGTGEDHSLFQAGVDASYEIDVFGGVRRNVEAANADLDTLIENQRDVTISIVAEVGRTYVDLRGFQRRVNLSEQIIRASAETVELTKARFNAGIAADLEVAQAQSQLATRQAQLPTYREGLRTSIHRLGVLLGQEPGSLLTELNPPTLSQPDAPIPKYPVPPSEVPVGLPSELLRRRPDIRRAERSLAAATARIGIATAELYPKFALGAGIGHQSSELGNFGDAHSREWSFGPSISWNLFTGGRIRLQIEAAGARQEQALYAFDQAILGSVEEVENALTSFIQQQARRAALQAAVAANERAVSLSLDRYRSGVGDFLNVLDTQRELYDSQDFLVQSETTVTRSLVSLYKALGGGWSDPAETQARGNTGTGSGL